MLSEKIIQKLKQNNISTDGDKTRQRVELLWKAASRSQQEQILQLSGVRRTTVYRIYKTGSISAKLAVPIAQTLNIDPLYLIGQSDERGACQEESLFELLSGLGYNALIKEHKREEKKRLGEANKKGVAEAAPAVEEPVQEQDEAGCCCCCAQQELLDALTEEELLLLLKGVLLRAKMGGKHQALANQIKALLIS